MAYTIEQVRAHAAAWMAQQDASKNLPDRNACPQCNGTGFDAWMSKVFAMIEATYGLSSDDLPDVCYSDWYEDGVKPATAAKRALRNAGAYKE